MNASQLPLDSCPACGVAAAIALPTGRRIDLASAELAPGPQVAVHCDVCGGASFGLDGVLRPVGKWIPTPDEVETLIRSAWPTLEWSAVVYVEPSLQDLRALLLRAAHEVTAE